MALDIVAMCQMARMLVNFARDERGATAIEYSFLAALMSIATIASIRQIGLSVSDMFAGIMTAFK